VENSFSCHEIGICILRTFAGCHCGKRKGKIIPVDKYSALLSKSSPSFSHKRQRISFTMLPNEADRETRKKIKTRGRGAERLGLIFKKNV